MSTKPKFDISKITGAYQLLGAFLLVVEGVLTFWIYASENVVERIVAGILMTFIFVYFLNVVRSMKSEEEVSTRISPPGLDELAVAEEVTTEEEMEHLESQRIGAPDGSYTINKPPDDWVVQKSSLVEWISGTFQITDLSLIEKFFGKSLQGPDVLLLQSKRITSVIPIPGKTFISGRILPSALQVSIQTQLAIMPIDRHQPPFFIEFPFEHNFMLQVSGVLQSNLATLYNINSGTIKNSNLRYIQADFRQELEDAIVNGREEKSVNINIVIIGIEGELQDHLLFMNYPSIPEADNLEMEQDHETLQSIMNSFRPLKDINPDEKRDEIQNMADQKFEDFLTEKGEDAFFTEFGLALFKLNDFDMDNPKKRLEAINMLKPFETFSKMVNLQYEDLDRLWDSLREAEKGDASNFKSQIKMLIEDAKGEEGKEGDLEALLASHDENENVENDVIES